MDRVRSQYPVSFASLREWSARNNLSLSEARVRFAQYAILRAIASSHTLRALLVFKGGNALDFVWLPNRSTRDLDFSLDMAAQPAALSVDALRNLLSPALMSSTQLLGVSLRIHKIDQQPPGEGKTFVTYDIAIGYALPDELKVRARIQEGQPSANVIPVEISLNEPICADQAIHIDPSHRLRVSTIEDIVAEKLRALLQQPIRNRSRRQDLLDIAVTLRIHSDLDRGQVSTFLITKAQARNVPVSRSAFHHPDIAVRARQDYLELKATTRNIFVPFDEALQALYDLVDDLDIPDRLPSD